jgi:hypothetical protein
MKALRKSYFLAGDAMNESNNGNCSFCDKVIPIDPEYQYDYDYAIPLECSECSKKMDWFVYGLIVGIIASGMMFYLFYMRG